MKRFHFRLDRVLLYLRQVELVQSGVVAVAERDRMRKQTEREQRRNERNALEDGIRAAHLRMEQEELMRSYAHAEFLTRTIGLLEDQIAELLVVVERERQVLYDMTKRRRVVEELRLRKRATYDADVERIERELLDEANARRQSQLSSNLEVL